MTSAEMAAPASLMTLDEVAEHTGLPAQTFEILAALGVGPRRMRLSRRTVYRLTDVDNWRAAASTRNDIKTAMTLVVDTLLKVASTFEQVP